MQLGRHLRPGSGAARAEIARARPASRDRCCSPTSRRCSTRRSREAVATFTSTCDHPGGRRGLRGAAHARDDGEAAGRQRGARAAIQNAAERGGIQVHRQLRDDVVSEPRRQSGADQGAEGAPARSARWWRWTATRARRRSASGRSSSAGSRIPAKNGGGALFDFGCYGANLMTWLMDNQRPARRDRDHAADQAASLSARGRRSDDPGGVSEGAGDHPGVVELAVRPEGFRGLRRARATPSRPAATRCGCACPDRSEEHAQARRRCRRTIAIRSRT